jgi:hypothetical protein
VKPVAGVATELVGLVFVVYVSRFVPPGLPFAVFVVLAQALSTYLIHCPAHYIAGRLVGIGFKTIKFGRTALAGLLPRPLAHFAGILPILTLVTDRRTLIGASGRSLAAMYASGAAASTASALAIAAAASIAEPFGYSVYAWAFAIVYLLFDVALSPKGGDLMRAKNALRAFPT